MHLLVDGHNLIGQVPGLSLADADDEARLVLLLRGYATRKRGRQVVVVFDRGVYGHPQKLDGYGVICHFAKSPQDADAQLIRRIRMLRRPREWTLVSSDKQVTRVAEECGVRVIGARQFVAQLHMPAAAPPAPAEKPEAQLSPAEIEEWLRIFGEPNGEDPIELPSPTDDGRQRDQAARPKQRKRRRGR